MRIFAILIMVFCFGCSDDDSKVDAGMLEASVEASVQDAAVQEDTQLSDGVEVEASVSDAQGE